jgi:hypothetical protein
MTRSSAPVDSVPCHACAGRFAFSFDGDRPTAHHTLPYCAAFDAISSTLDALRFAELCDAKVKAGKPP